jgi:hypothetical protein
MFDVGEVAEALTLARKTPTLLTAEIFHDYGDSATYGMGEKRQMESPKPQPFLRLRRTAFSLLQNRARRGTRDLIPQCIRSHSIRPPVEPVWLFGNRSGRERLIQG